MNLFAWRLFLFFTALAFVVSLGILEYGWIRVAPLSLFLGFSMGRFEDKIRACGVTA